MPYSLKQAAAACGRSRSSVYEAIKSGRLKAEQDEKGRFVIQPDDLKNVFPEHSENVQAEQEKTQINEEKHSLFLQTIESLENAVEALREERNEWREQAKAAATTIEKQAEALAMATAASARAITQADEMRRQLIAIEHSKPEPKADTSSAPPTDVRAAVRPVFWMALAAATIAAAASWQLWWPWWTGVN
jgi:DNA repair exonuclease SbcCD ATPase subunit